jgi:hypothetical protein
VVPAVVGAVLVAVALALPWATVERVIRGTAERYGAGAAGVLLLVFAVVSVAATYRVGVSAPWWLRITAVGAAIAGLVTASVIALSRIAAANRAAMTQVGGSRTSYAVGAAVGVLGALIVLIGAVVGVASAGEHPQTDRVG